MEQIQNQMDKTQKDKSVNNSYDSRKEHKRFFLVPGNMFLVMFRHVVINYVKKSQTNIEIKIKSHNKEKLNYLIRKANTETKQYSTENEHPNCLGETIDQTTGEKQHAAE